MNKSSGFSVLEMLVVLALIGVVVLVSASTLSSQTHSTERLSLVDDEQRYVLLAGELLREQIQPTGSGVDSRATTLRFGCNGTHLEVYTHYIDTTIATPTERLFFFSIVTDRNGDRLTRGTYEPDTLRKGPRQPLVQNIVQMGLHAVIDESGKTWEAHELVPGQLLRSSVIRLSIVGNETANTVTTISLPIAPDVKFLPSWGPICA